MMISMWDISSNPSASKAMESVDSDAVFGALSSKPRSLATIFLRTAMRGFLCQQLMGLCMQRTLNSNLDIEN